MSKVWKARSISCRYTKDSPLVLDDVSFDIKSGERVGVGMSMPAICYRRRTDLSSWPHGQWEDHANFVDAPDDPDHRSDIH